MRTRECVSIHVRARRMGSARARSLALSLLQQEKMAFAHGADALSISTPDQTPNQTPNIPHSSRA